MHQLEQWKKGRHPKHKSLVKRIAPQARAKSPGLKIDPQWKWPCELVVLAHVIDAQWKRWRIQLKGITSSVISSPQLLTTAERFDRLRVEYSGFKWKENFNKQCLLFATTVHSGKVRSFKSELQSSTSLAFDRSSVNFEAVYETGLQTCGALDMKDCNNGKLRTTLHVAASVTTDTFRHVTTAIHLSSPHQQTKAGLYIFWKDFVSKWRSSFALQYSAMASARSGSLLSVCNRVSVDVKERWLGAEKGIISTNLWITLRRLLWRLESCLGLRMVQVLVVLDTVLAWWWWFPG